MAELLQQPAPEQCDGVSLLPVFKGEAARQPVYRYWEFWDVLPKGARTKENRENSYQEAPVTEMPIELYDLDADPGESHNLAAQFPEVAARMLSYMEEAHTPLQKPTTAEGVRK